MGHVSRVFNLALRYEPALEGLFSASEPARALKGTRHLLGLGYLSTLNMFHFDIQNKQAEKALGKDQKKDGK